MILKLFPAAGKVSSLSIRDSLVDEPIDYGSFPSITHLSGAPMTYVTVGNYKFMRCQNRWQVSGIWEIA